MVHTKYTSATNEDFRRLFKNLPTAIQEQTKTAYKQFCEDPNHPSLRFKQLQGKESPCSARVNDQYRVVGSYGAEIIWYWIGTKNEFKKLF